jgi:hypothetical protein
LEYVANFHTNNMQSGALPLSQRRFIEIWGKFCRQERVRVRRKANTTTKCDDCDGLHIELLNPALTRSQRAAVLRRRQVHHAHIRKLRKYYTDDVQRSLGSLHFQTVVFDGTNSALCNCPLSWRSHLRNEAGEDTFVKQKIQSVLIHGRALIYYVFPPYVKNGMDLTASVLVDALRYISPQVSVVRFQYDGALD